MLGLRGRHQVINVAVAIRLAESLRDLGFAIPQSAIIKGIESANHPGRLELWQGRPAFLFDGAHNPSGALALRDYLKEFVSVPLTLVFGAMRDKNLEEMAAILFPMANQLILTQTDNARAASVESMERVTSRVAEGNTIKASSVRDATSIARRITPGGGLVCFTGSLYLIGEVQALMKQTPEVPARDGKSLSEETP